MKKVLLILSITTLFSFSSFAANDVAQGSCLFKISKNKSKFKVLRSSELGFDDITIRPLNRFLAKGNISKVYVNPKNLLKEKRNKVLIFTEDVDRLKALGTIPHKVVDFSRPIYFTVEYVGKGMKAGAFSGPGVRVSTMTQRGKVDEKFIGLKEGVDTDFQANVPARTIYRIFGEEDGVTKHKATKTHTSKMKLECNFKVVDKTLTVVKEEDEKEEVEREIIRE